MFKTGARPHKENKMENIEAMHGNSATVWRLETRNRNFLIRHAVPTGEPGRFYTVCEYVNAYGQHIRWAAPDRSEWIWALRTWGLMPEAGRFVAGVWEASEARDVERDAVSGIIFQAYEKILELGVARGDFAYDAYSCALYDMAVHELGCLPMSYDEID